MKKIDTFIINNETINNILKDKKCRNFISIINTSKRDRIISKYTYRLYSRIKKIYNCKNIEISYTVLDMKKVKNGYRFIMKTKGN